MGEFAPARQPEKREMREGRLVSGPRSVTVDCRSMEEGGILYCRWADDSPETIVLRLNEHYFAIPLVQFAKFLRHAVDVTKASCEALAMERLPPGSDV